MRYYELTDIATGQTEYIICTCLLFIQEGWYIREITKEEYNVHVLKNVKEDE